MMQDQLQMTCRVPYPIPYILLLGFNALAFVVNILYDQLNNGNWSPPAMVFQSEMFRQRPYQILVFVMDCLSAVIFVVYMLMPRQAMSNQTQSKMVIRWFSHVIAFSFVLVIWLFNVSQLWIYKYVLYDFVNDLRIASNDKWDVFYTILYGVVIAYGLIVAFPCVIYLLWFYFVKAEENYKENPTSVYFHKAFNKICFFATYISIIVVISLNLSYLGDYQYYFITTLYPVDPNAYLQVEMSLPVTYIDYVFSGLALLFAVFLFIKQIFDTMKSKKKHIRRQLLVLTSSMFCIGVLLLNRIVEVSRMNLAIKRDYVIPTQPFLQLYDHLRTIMWCYIFLLFPLTIYSIRNYWRQWKNQFASGENTDIHVSDYHNLDEKVAQPERREYSVEKARPEIVENEESRRKRPQVGVKVEIASNGKVQVQGSDPRLQERLVQRAQS